jgi:Immunity protein 7
MFEYHGWAAVFDSLDSDFGAADCLTQSAYDAVADALARVRSDFQVADLRVVNGSCHVWLAGYRNHRQNAVIDAFRDIAAVAPWSYGILYVHDDEAGDDENHWISWVMKRGVVVPHHDRFLSPHVGEVEDPLD